MLVTHIINTCNTIVSRHKKKKRIHGEMMKTRLFLLLGSFFGQTSAIFSCRTHCQDVCENFVVGSGCWEKTFFGNNPSQCGNRFPQCKRKGQSGASCPFGTDELICNSMSQCNWCRADASCYCNVWGCAVSKREIIIVYDDRL